MCNQTARMRQGRKTHVMLEIGMLCFFLKTFLFLWIFSLLFCTLFLKAGSWDFLWRPLQRARVGGARELRALWVANWAMTGSQVQVFGSLGPWPPVGSGQSWTCSKSQCYFSLPYLVPHFFPIFLCHYLLNKLLPPESSWELGLMQFINKELYNKIRG